MKFRRGSRGLGPATLSWERDPVPLVQEGGWAPGPVWTGAENLTCTGIRSPDRPGRSESLSWPERPTYPQSKENTKLSPVFWRQRHKNTCPHTCTQRVPGDSL